MVQVEHKYYVLLSEIITIVQVELVRALMALAECAAEAKQQYVLLY